MAHMELKQEVQLFKHKDNVFGYCIGKGNELYNSAADAFNRLHTAATSLSLAKNKKEYKAALEDAKKKANEFIFHLEIGIIKSQYMPEKVRDGTIKWGDDPVIKKAYELTGKTLDIAALAKEAEQRRLPQMGETEEKPGILKRFVAFLSPDKKEEEKPSEFTKRFQPVIGMGTRGNKYIDTNTGEIVDKEFINKEWEKYKKMHRLM